MNRDIRGMSQGQLTEMLHSACFKWGASRVGSILEIQEIYREFAIRVGEKARIVALVKLAEAVRKHGDAANALVPFMWEDPSISVVMTATIEFAASAPADPGDEMTGPSIVVSMIDNARNLPEMNRAGMINGLLMLGDRRILPLLGDAWIHVEETDLVPFLTTGTGFVYRGWIEFLLGWAESMDPETDTSYGAVAHVLHNVPEEVNLAAERIILDVERSYPITDGGITRVGEWTVQELGAKLEKFFQHLAARETTEPVLMNRVMEAWGLRPIS